MLILLGRLRGLHHGFWVWLELIFSCYQEHLQTSTMEAGVLALADPKCAQAGEWNNLVEKLPIRPWVAHITIAEWFSHDLSFPICEMDTLFFICFCGSQSQGVGKI